MEERLETCNLAGFEDGGRILELSNVSSHFILKKARKWILSTDSRKEPTLLTLRSLAQ